MSINGYGVFNQSLAPLRINMTGGYLMQIYYAILLLLMGVSMTMTYFTEAYSMSIVFCATAGLLGFLIREEAFKDSQLDYLEDKIACEMSKIDDYHEACYRRLKENLEALEKENQDLKARVDKASFGKLSQR